jgi:hypothetical protein
MMIVVCGLVGLRGLVVALEEGRKKEEKKGG